MTEFPCISGAAAIDFELMAVDGFILSCELHLMEKKSVGGTKALNFGIEVAEYLKCFLGEIWSTLRIRLLAQHS